jgi:tRNA A37 threonylcarbamoyladenosine modification protein TsaB
MTIEILLENDIITINLLKNRKLVDSSRFEVKNSLSNTLLAALDALLKKNKIGKNEIKKIITNSNLPDSYTSGRIIKSFAKTYLFGSASLKDS